MDWHDEADVVVLGFGAAGSAAGLTAVEAGASVILVEKQARNAHTPNIR
jgi:succinate dehydrogenase/fumarate reductase flavoprotein subunit